MDHTNFSTQCSPLPCLLYFMLIRWQPLTIILLGDLDAVLHNFVGTTIDSSGVQYPHGSYSTCLNGIAYITELLSIIRRE